ncbi:alpha-protein kinase 3 [Mastacembelus armatus]|uniref:alpha-protein kinase 3 n=1 Tax=Mastacembelus armatus TaxID=205130 RepID=UPI000E461329|nr:alpha-protein kinase 3 [Mastacembelus armatus]XP_026189554.1 alpha-protein kinase 3 [Mastacembelus armatus]
MGSRRTTPQSSFGNGRSSSVDDTNNNSSSSGSRPGTCSYLSNVRPEIRSTLCSVIAQLTEETQPFFETTLKSKAVSENSNVKFSCVITGYPIPQVTWYKDDMQLDRYCGLPKYEIFRDGQNHSLQIYNCTVDDAAIYQASACNTKGIVSCSGVLEVGEMNEFNIHQRYFAKLKQKAEHRRREAEGKENQEPLRTLSPERTQRKRRSTMEAFLSTPSSTEDEGSEENHVLVAVETETRLQEAAVGEAEEKLVPVTNGAVSAVTNGQVINENGNMGGTYIQDSAQRIFNGHQAKTPFVKKKIKISKTLGERTPEGKRKKEEPSPSGAAGCTESVQSKAKSEEVMEVESVVNASVVDSDAGKIAKHDKSAREEAMLVARPSKGVHAAPLQKEQLMASPVPPTRTSRTVAGSEGKQAARREKKAARKDTAETLENQRKSPHITLKQSSMGLHALKRAVTETEDFSTRMDVDEKPNSSTGGSLGHPGSGGSAYEGRTASPQRPLEEAEAQLSERETSQKNVAVSGPAPPAEFTQARTKMNRNDAPVNLELPPDQCATDTQPPQKTPRGRAATADDIQTPCLHSGLQVPIDIMTQDTWDHSRGSSENPAILFTDVQKSPLERLGGGEHTRGCNVSPSTLQSHVDTAIKSVEGMEIQVDEKVEVNEVGKLLVQDDSEVPNQKTVEMETESAALHVVEQNKTGKKMERRDAVDKGADVVTADESFKETEKNDLTSKMAEISNSELENVKPDKSETALPLTNNMEDTNSPEQIMDFQEVPEPVSKVLSIAELLRSQIKALDSTPPNSVPTIPIHVDFEQEPATTAAETCQELKDDERKYKEEVEKDRKMETTVNNTSDTNIKETYHQLNESDQHQIQIEAETSSHVQALPKPTAMPHVSVTDTGTTVEVTARKYGEGQRTEASLLAPLIDVPGSSLTDSVKHKPVRSGSPTKVRGLESETTVVEHAKDEPVQGKDTEEIQKLISEIKLNSKTERSNTEINSMTLLDQCKREDHNTNTSSLQSIQKFPTKSVFDTGTQESTLQQDSSVVEELSRTTSITTPTPEASPLLRKRNCVSPIPSATPQELASGARRKIPTAKSKSEEATEATSAADNQTQKKEACIQSSHLSAGPVTPSTSPSLSRRSLQLQPPGERTSPEERRSPLLSRRKTTVETQAPSQQPSEETEGRPAEKGKHNPFKAPQVIRKIRGETFADASGHLKLWCQFFNVLSDSTIKWYKNEEDIAQIKRKSGDETQVNLAIVQASAKDSGVYRCSIENEYGTDSTDLLLSAEILAGMTLREDLGVGEEIEMTPMIFSKGVADSGVWGNKLFGRIMMKESHIGDGCSHKVWRAKVIYGLEPVFESGHMCIIKVCNPIPYGGKEESRLVDRNLDIIEQACKIQNLAREYCKIFSTEARLIENFGSCLEVIPVYLMYRPANPVPYATVEADLTGLYQKYSFLDHTGRMEMRTGSGVEQKCCALQHWIFQWTSGNLLLTQLEGVDTKITNVGISVKSTGHQGLSIEGNPKVFEQFVSQHQCNYFCGLLGLRSLKVMDSLSLPAKSKGSRSPLLQRKMAAGSSSPQTGRKAGSSPRLPRKAEQEGRKTPTKQKTEDAPKVV